MREGHGLRGSQAMLLRLGLAHQLTTFGVLADEAAGFRGGGVVALEEALVHGGDEGEDAEGDRGGGEGEE